MLAECLAQHPQVVTRDEVFHDDRVLDKWRRSIWQNDPITYLNRFEFRWYPPAIRAVGFGIHYNSCLGPPRGPLWQYLAHSDFKIVHMKRNLLHVFVDAKIARQTGTWNARSEEEARSSREATIYVDYEECRRYMEWMAEHRQAADHLFSQSDRIDLWYEDLVSGFEAQIQHIEDWLGIDRRPLVPRTVRQVSRPMHEVIANYADLRRKFEGTPLISQFDD